MKPLVSKDKRPVNLDIGSMKLPITAYVSISHRVSGVLLFIATGLLVWALDVSLASEQGFNDLATLLSSPFAKLIVWAIVSVMSYHALSGIKHMVMDFGIGESLEGGVLGAKIVIGCAALLTVVWGIVIW